jgi:hypothetical protein
MIPIVIGSGLAAYAFYVLGERLAAAEREASSACAGSNDTLAILLREYCRGVVAGDMLAATTGLGFMETRVRYRDHNDRFTTVGELLRTMEPKLGSSSYSDILQLVRLFYQLDYTLGPAPERCGGILNEFERRLIANDGTRDVGRVERLARGQRCDPQKMTLVRSGSHVDQPLGFVV